jgi:hypothetical protein
VQANLASEEPATIVTAKNPHRRGRLGDVPDVTPEEHKRRGDAAAISPDRFRRGARRSPPSTTSSDLAQSPRRFNFGQIFEQYMNRPGLARIHCRTTT